MSSKEYRKTARDALKGNWGKSILVTFVAILLGANAGSGTNTFSAPAAGGNDTSTLQNSGIDLSALSPAVVGVMTVILSLLVLYAIAVILFGGAAKLGLITYNIDLITRRKDPAFSTLFSRFSIFFKAILLQLFMGLFIFLWMLLLIIPGIIATYRYAMAPYIMADNPGIGVREAVNRSKEMMKGNKMRLFLLELSFIGWAILCVLTLGIGLLWLNPYVSVASTAFYLDISGQMNDNQAQPMLQQEAV